MLNEPQDPKRPVEEKSKEEKKKDNREAGFDRTLKESSPASDPPSSIPDPEDDDAPGEPPRQIEADDEAQQ